MTRLFIKPLIAAVAAITIIVGGMLLLADYFRCSNLNQYTQAYRDCLRR